MLRAPLLCLLLAAAVFATEHDNVEVEHPSGCFIPTGMEHPIQICINGTTGETYTLPVPEAYSNPVDDLKAELHAAVTDVDIFYVLLCGVLVFFMQAGFSMLEVGCVTSKNTQNILYKNLMDACLGAFGFWFLGYGFAYGKDTSGGFIGASNFFITEYTNDENAFHMWFFQWAFAATAATIVSGSVAERCSLFAYFVYSVVLTVLVYPLVVHWVWSGDGWLSAFNSDKYFTNNMMDFAGSGVVHMVGGFSGLMGALALGPRNGRFLEGGEDKYRPQNVLVASLGVIILWVGWYGFNAGSTLAIRGYGVIAAKVAVTTTIAAALGAITATIYSRAVKKNYDLMLSLNGVLAGLVSVTAGCCVVEPWGAAVIGIVGALLFIGLSNLLKHYQIDDPLDAFPIHGGCGAWGVIAVGMFGLPSNIEWAYGGDGAAFVSGEQLAVQCLGVLVIAVWSMACSGALFFGLNAVGVLRVDKETENKGMDLSEHGGTAYNSSQNLELGLVRVSEKHSSNDRLVNNQAEVNING